MSQHLISSALVASQLNPLGCGPDRSSHILFFDHLQVFSCSCRGAVVLRIPGYWNSGGAERATDRRIVYLIGLWKFLYIRMILILKLDMNMQDLSAGLVSVLPTDNLQ